jgi:hypothetical protein
MAASDADSWAAAPRSADHSSITSSIRSARLRQLRRLHRLRQRGLYQRELALPLRVQRGKGRVGLGAQAHQPVVGAHAPKKQHRSANVHQPIDIMARL